MCGFQVKYKYLNAFLKYDSKLGVERSVQVINGIKKKTGKVVKTQKG